MEINRKPFQGVGNIISFNRHFYFLALFLLCVLLVVRSSLGQSYYFVFNLFLVIALLMIIVPLLVSWYIYDNSGFYKLDWYDLKDKKELLNINAGFDEISEIIKQKFPKSKLTVCDFYNSEKHTEISIKRARKRYPPVPGTLRADTGKLPFGDQCFDAVLAVFSVHEIRNETERDLFFKEINRITKDSGSIFVTEHLRDFNNFLAYNIGFFHFHSKKAWLKSFRNANLTVIEEVSKTPFITTFILKKDGNPT